MPARMAGMGLVAAAMANRLLSRTTPIFAKMQTTGSRTRPTLFRGVARPHAPSGLNSMQLDSRMKTSQRLGAATESRMRSGRKFRTREPKSWVAAAPPKSLRATKNEAMYAPIPPHFFHGILSIAKAADTAAPATRRYTILQRIQRAAVTGKTSPKRGAAPQNLLFARRSSSSSLEEVVVALQANLHLHVMDTIREQDPLTRSAFSLSPLPSPLLSRERHHMAFAHQEDVCALC